jgi:competence protein ComEA
VKITKPERVALLITWTLLIFIGGVFFGRSTQQGVITVSTASEAAVQTSETAEAVSEQVSQNESTEAAPVESTETTETERLNLNKATLEQLEELPGVGPVLAQRILDYREEFGGFIVVEELLEVDGIGDKTYESIKNLVDVRD